MDIGLLLMWVLEGWVLVGLCADFAGCVGCGFTFCF